MEEKNDVVSDKIENIADNDDMQDLKIESEVTSSDTQSVCEEQQLSNCGDVPRRIGAWRSVRKDEVDENGVSRALLAEVGARAAREIFGDEHVPFGGCYSVWERQKSILKDEFGIDWQSPAERYPFVRFD